MRGRELARSRDWKRRVLHTDMGESLSEGRINNCTGDMTSMVYKHIRTKCTKMLAVAGGLCDLHFPLLSFLWKPGRRLFKHCCLLPGLPGDRGTAAASSGLASGCCSTNPEVAPGPQGLPGKQRHIGHLFLGTCPSTKGRGRGPSPRTDGKWRIVFSR